ncbi:Rho termination factor N-terminal domain-containing protein [Chroogloeocystis siderophila]|jgi:hypothetical protein|uniref:Rho termination factor-like N-terminal domain-containing protein n=1 Tax=Chroogloeocystis siderophila 5.2 s.c.1 TaxID=247279 RepID=A0A1U7HIE9_9CHRO|nr:Rho termination factor N-terminal domain-containing protein [Chroogloeocystis siderophila]OKH23334.1 hypothetical protein NIES1031_17925 [Chroogloeocystis siderophila 5.2 s.c.1]
MKLSISLVAVKKIKSNIDASKFSEEELEQAANLILEAEGVINPLIIQRVSRDSYEVIDGDFEYYAAIKAKEKNPLQGEMIGAFIIDAESEDVIKKQVELIRKHHKNQNEVPENYLKIEKKLNLLNELIKEKLSFLSGEMSLLLEKVNKVEEYLIESQKPKLTKKQKNTVNTANDYASMTVPQLKEVAKEKGIRVPSKIKKDDLIAAIESK